ncbi:hypothetical protein PVAP13_2KG345004 [Panicum virgatum]|uniref:Uncharacterized protein n=1 Tax=Panicum virgatum TaxID=38727 RepID=A0A8T0WCH3_PANVG|nr:hypothetical protein PVAP13_2KG345004 [Panicum virgatum]
MSRHTAAGPSTSATISTAVPITSAPPTTAPPPTTHPEIPISVAPATDGNSALHTLTTAIYGLQRQMNQFATRLATVEGRPPLFSDEPSVTVRDALQSGAPTPPSFGLPGYGGIPPHQSTPSVVDAATASIYSSAAAPSPHRPTAIRRRSTCRRAVLRPGTRCPALATPPGGTSVLRPPLRRALRSSSANTWHVWSIGSAGYYIQSVTATSPPTDRDGAREPSMWPVGLRRRAPSAAGHRRRRPRIHSKRPHPNYTNPLSTLPIPDSITALPAPSPPSSCRTLRWSSQHSPIYQAFLPSI